MRRSLLFGICLIVAMLVILVRRWRAASAAARRVLTPMYLTGTVCMLAIGVGGDLLRVRRADRRRAVLRVRR